MKAGNGMMMRVREEGFVIDDGCTTDAFYNEFSTSKNKGIEVNEYVAMNQGDFKKRDYCVMFP